MDRVSWPSVDFRDYLDQSGPILRDDTYDATPIVRLGIYLASLGIISLIALVVGFKAPLWIGFIVGFPLTLGIMRLIRSRRRSAANSVIAE